MIKRANKEVKKSTIYIKIDREIFKSQKGDFIIYLGMVKKDYPELNLFQYQDISIKTNGIELSSGNKEIVGILGDYQGKPSFEYHFENVRMDSKEAQINILTTIDGIGEITAEELVNKLPGGTTIENFRNENFKVDGISINKADKIRKALSFFDSMETLKNLNIMLKKELSQKQISSLSENLDSKEISIDEFKKNPYDVLIKEMGYSFLKTDRIAQAVGIKFNDSCRIKYLIEYLVKKNLESGSCYLDKSDLIEILKKQNLFRNLNDEKLIKLIENNDRLYIEENRVYDIMTNISEVETAFQIRKFATKKIFKYKESEIFQMINSFEKIEGFKLHKTQKEAVITAINNPISVITGGAGTGKSTIVKCIVYCLKNSYKRCVLTAPTGKAARRLSECTEHKASTIHSFLLNDYISGNIKIVDESSMIDIHLMSDLLHEIKHYDKLILVGDVGQLPSVGPGNVLNDIIESGIVEVIKLEKTFRQAKDSNIIKISQLIRNNEKFDFMQKKDFFVRVCNKPNDYFEIGLHYYDYLKNKYSCLDNFYNDVQFIIPMKGKEDGRTEVKTHYYNKLIKDKYNKKTNKKDWFKFDKNDKVMNLENDSENDISNGEVGRITEVTKVDFTVYFMGLEKYITFEKTSENMKRFQFAYVCTVHKLQGSEYKYICLLIPEKSFFMDSRLLYTGITRGKQTVIMLTTKDIIDSIVIRTNANKRKTYLKERIQKEYEDYLKENQLEVL